MLLNEIPNGHDKYRITANGRLVERERGAAGGQYGDYQRPHQGPPPGPPPPGFGMGPPPPPPPHQQGPGYFMGAGPGHGRGWGPQ